jgi:hypothetical protein
MIVVLSGESQDPKLESSGCAKRLAVVLFDWKAGHLKVGKSG